MRSFHHRWVLVLSALDELSFAVLVALTWDLHFPRPVPDFLFPILLLPVWSFLFWYFGVYESHRLEGFRGLLGRMFTAQAAGLFVMASLMWVVGLHGQYDSLWHFTAWDCAIVLATRWVLYFALGLMRRKGLDLRHVCVLGSWDKASEMARRFSQNPEWGLRVSVVGSASRNTAGSAGEAREFFAYPSGETRPASTFEEILHHEVIDEVLLAVRPEELPAEERTIQLCKQYGVLCRILLHTGSAQGEAVRLDDWGGELAVPVSGPQHNQLALWLKRGIDIVISALLLILLAPVFLILAVLVKLSSPGPALFRQRRVGLHGRKFTMIKFRTMLDDAESFLPSVAHRNITGGPVFKDRQDWRITEVGRILRRFSLDELPQLWNVLRGDMSLVGPRPLPTHESDAIDGPHRRRFAMRPGITCLWQVQGRSMIEYSRWMSLDLEYVDNWSIWLDAKLLLQTIPVVLSGRGAY